MTIEEMGPILPLVKPRREPPPDSQFWLHRYYRLYGGYPAYLGEHNRSVTRCPAGHEYEKAGPRKRVRRCGICQKLRTRYREPQVIRENFLRRHGWDEIRNTPYCWRDPQNQVRYALSEAVAVQKARNIRTIKEHK